ncbi:MAG: 50S ribosomal protein L25/general stress protein Ctc [Burkholderiales bacterium]
MQIELSATKRAAQGTGASRRLRHAGKVPGILYGGAEPPLTIELDHNELYLQARHEAFHASIITLTLDGQKQQVLLRAINMHPWKAQVQHIDFQRVRADQKIHVKVPLHFLHAERSPAVKEAAAVINHVINDIEISCLPADLPEFIEIDLSKITVGHSIHVKELAFPQGVTPVLHRGEDPVVASASLPKAVPTEEEEAAAVAEVVPASQVPAAKQQPETPDAAAAGAAPAKPEKGEKPAKAEKGDKK